MIGKKLYKGMFTSQEYMDTAIWCNSNHATIVDKGEYYEVVELPGPTLEGVKRQKIAELKAERDSAEESPVHTDLGDFDFDVKSRDRINGAKDVLKGTDTRLEWTLANNEEVSVGYDDLKTVTDTAAVRCNMLHLKYRDLRDLVNGCTTIEEVKQISWDIINEEA